MWSVLVSGRANNSVDWWCRDEWQPALEVWSRISTLAEYVYVLDLIIRVFPVFLPPHGQCNIVGGVDTSLSHNFILTRRGKSWKATCACLKTPRATASTTTYLHVLFLIWQSKSSHGSLYLLYILYRLDKQKHEVLKLINLISPRHIYVRSKISWSSVLDLPSCATRPVWHQDQAASSMTTRHQAIHRHNM